MRGKGRLAAVHEVDEEEGGKIEEWDKEDKMGCMGDSTVMNCLHRYLTSHNG